MKKHSTRAPSSKKSAGKKKPKAPAKHAKPAAGAHHASGAAAGHGSPLPSVRVRMFRQGLGDCILMTFTIGGKEKHVLIDCGTLGATTTGVTMPQVVAEIRAATKDHLDLLIATHEHKDHVSGFGSLKEEFKKLKVDRVWLAWTENPKDALARKLAKTKADLAAALTAAVDLLTGPGASGDAEAMGLAAGDVLGFSVGIDEAMDFVRSGVGVPPVFLEPGNGPLAEEWLPGFRIFVLGPPKDHDALFDEGEHGSSELYGLARSLNTAVRFLSSGETFRKYSLDPGSSAERAAFDAQSPFDARFRHETDSPRALSFARDYLAPAESWRRIDGDWLRIVPELALQLDSATNNTSVVLAIERIADGKVLLLPADAQQGNWLSWHDAKIAWDVPDAAGKSHHVTAADLLRRTVFYKVGHHASHNATARAKGLELMESPDLTAFIPVDRAVALKRHPKGSWRMPARPLYRRLLEKCSGRVVRSDLGFAAPAKGAAASGDEKEFVGMATPAEWADWQTAQKAAAGFVQVTPIYVEFTLK